jgi:transposase
MQETDFYQQLLDLPGLQVTGVNYETNRITLFCATTTEQAPCPLCLKPTAQLHQYTTRKVRDLDISGRQVWLQIQLRQLLCPACNRFFNQPLNFADPAKSYTHRQAKWVVECCARQPFSEVGALLDMCPKTVERLYYSHVSKSLNLPQRYAQVKRLGIDEIAHRKGKADYCCVLTDLDRGIALDVLASRSKAVLLAHFQKLGSAFCQQIEAVSMDMWPGYHHISQQCFPQALRVVDRFHVVKALNAVLDGLRRKLRREQADEAAFKAIKWLLFKRILTDSEQAKLRQAYAQSPLLEQVVALRNAFHTCLDEASDSLTLQARLLAWIGLVEQVGYAGFEEFVSTLTRWLEPIANYASTQLTNAVTEGLNNLIRYLKRVSFGLPNFDHLRLRVLAQAI